MPCIIKVEKIHEFSLLLFGEKTMIQSEERNDLLPVCPHCKAEIKKVYYQEVSSVFGKRYIYFCPNCRSVLGVSHRKGFWMG